LPRLSRNTLSQCASFVDDAATSKNLYRWKSEDTLVRGIPTIRRAKRYVDIRTSALQQRRSRASTEGYPYDMVILYQFWSHYLVRNFNTRMFEEFQKLAEEDFAVYGNVVGMLNLSQYFASALLHHNSIPTIVLKNLIRLAQDELEPSHEELMAFRSLKVGLAARSS
jgi:la-related protein 1